MNKSFKSLSRISSLFYKRTGGSSYTCRKQYVHNVQNHPLNTLKGTCTSHGAHFSKLSTDNVIQELQMCKEPEKIMEIMQTNYNAIDLNRALAALTSLYAICKNPTTIEYVANSREYSILCGSLHKHLRYMTVQEALHSLNLMLHFDTARRTSKTVLMQSLLQVIRSSINELSVKNIITLHYALKKMSTTPLTAALSEALPILFDIRLRIELDNEDIDFMATAVTYVTQAKCSKSTLTTLLQAVRDLGLNISGPNAYRLYRDLATMDMEHVEDLTLYFEVMSNLQKIILRRGMDLNVNKIITLIKRMVTMILLHEKYLGADSKSFSIYNEALIDECINWLLSKQINLEDAARVLRNLNKITYINLRFLDYITAKFYMKEFDSATDRLSTLAAMYIITAVSKADYKPVFWDNIEKAIIENVLRFCKDRNDYIVKLNYCVHLATLNHYNAELLKEVFTFSLNDKKMHRLLLLYQCVKMFYPEYTGPFLDESVLAKASIHNFTGKISLKYAIEQGLGGPQYVLHGLKTKLGHFIDHAVAMRKGGYPIAIRNENSNTNTENTVDISTLQVSPDSQIILVLNVHVHGYARNCQRLNGAMCLYIKTLEALTGYNVVAINSTMWQGLLEHEKIPYLMQAIKLKCKDIEWD